MPNTDGKKPARRTAKLATERIRVHERWLRTVIGSRVGDAEAVDDLVQEIYVTVLAHPERFDRVRQVEPWLYRVAVRLALQHRRRAGRQRRHMEKLHRHACDRDDRSVDPFEWLMAREAHDLVSASMDQLSRVDRELLKLKHAHGWTYQEMSDHLGVTISTIEYRLLRARQRLRRLISIASPAEV